MIRSVFSLVLLLAMAGCAREKEARVEPPPAPAKQTQPSPVTLLPDRGASLYELDITLVDQNDESFALDELAGKPVVITMFYASCPIACPTLISDIERAVEHTSPDARSELVVLLVSLDPERDTPAAMKALAARHQLDLPNWRFTRTSAESTRELAAVLGVKYKVLENGAIRHTSLISALDERGVVRFRQQSPVAADDSSVSLALDALAQR